MTKIAKKLIVNDVVKYKMKYKIKINFKRLGD
jgi:hypothetical protein